MILPVYALTRNPILCYNVALSLDVRAVGDRDVPVRARADRHRARAAFLAGLAFGFAPYRFGTLPHLQVLSSMWMPFVLLGFHRFLETPPRRAAGRRGGRVARAESVVRILPAVLQSGRRALPRPRDDATTALWSIARTLSRGGRDRRRGVAPPRAVPAARTGSCGASASARDRWRNHRVLGGRLGVRDRRRRTLWLWGSRCARGRSRKARSFPGFAIALLAASPSCDHWRRSRADRAARRRPCRLRAVGLAGCSRRRDRRRLRFCSAGRSAIPSARPIIKLTSLDRGLDLRRGARWPPRCSRSRRARATTARRGWWRRRSGSHARHGARVRDVARSADLRARPAGRRTRRLRAVLRLRARIRRPARAGALCDDRGARAGRARRAAAPRRSRTRRRRRASCVAVAGVLIVAESWAAPIADQRQSTRLQAARPDAAARHAASAGAARRLPLRRTAAAVARVARAAVRRGGVRNPLHVLFDVPLAPLVNGYSGGAPEDYGGSRRRCRSARRARARVAGARSSPARRTSSSTKRSARRRAAPDQRWLAHRRARGRGVRRRPASSPSAEAELESCFSAVPVHILADRWPPTRWRISTAELEHAQSSRACTASCASSTTSRRRRRPSITVRSSTSRRTTTSA